MLPLSFGLLITGLYSVNNQEVIMNQRISPTPEQTAAAWVEFKQWYANCITAAPKASAGQEGVTFAHIYSWCRHWDIDTAALDAICNKFNIPIEEGKQAVLKPNPGPNTDQCSTGRKATGHRQLHVSQPPFEGPCSGKAGEDCRPSTQRSRSLRQRFTDHSVRSRPRGYQEPHRSHTRG